VSLFETSALTHTHTRVLRAIFIFYLRVRHIYYIYINVHTHRLVCCSSTYVPIYIYTYSTHILSYIVCTIVVHIFTLVCLCVWKHSRWRRRTWRRYLDWAQCSEAIYNIVCIIYVSGVCCENSFFSACGNRWPYVLNLV